MSDAAPVSQDTCAALAPPHSRAHHLCWQVLVAYYQQQRQAEERSQARTTIRMLESLVRVSQVRAAREAMAVLSFNKALRVV